MAGKSTISLAPRLLPVTNLVTPAKSSAPTDPVRRISSRALLGRSSSLIIDHEGVSYVLRATRLGKLILTK
ncbi:MAG: hemin uptake protein HemP [Rhodocyclaceae bacterium]|uniref:hemin uptake protein HemP n=1 Tax=Fluviibacter phosphoraccumulans TaxID=1751046 RepID=UPI001B558D11|nr:hemin uptake protein HemP [Fluviibacter phosphoraccumulans]MBP7991868.1 hemin uptake protein HemP [Rhodocyclaceae bacterium]